MEILVLGMAAFMTAFVMGEHDREKYLGDRKEIEEIAFECLEREAPRLDWTPYDGDIVHKDRDL